MDNDHKFNMFEETIFIFFYNKMVQAFFKDLFLHVIISKNK